MVTLKITSSEQMHAKLFLNINLHFRLKLLLSKTFAEQ